MFSRCDRYHIIKGPVSLITATFNNRAVSNSVRKRVRAGSLKSKSRDVIAAYVTRTHERNKRAWLRKHAGTFDVHFHRKLSRRREHVLRLSRKRSYRCELEVTLRIRPVFFISAVSQRTCRLPKLRARYVVNLRAYVNTWSIAERFVRHSKFYRRRTRSSLLRWTDYQLSRKISECG